LLVTEAYLVLVALLLGSFINMAVDRLPRGESLVRPRSHCRTCGRVLNTVDLLPVAGYLIRRGRCGTCRSAIGVSSPLIEAATGTCMLVALAWLGLWPGAAAGFALVGLLGLGSVGLSVVVRRQGAVAASGR
jgi:prepilin signal peptidase PulO-like enzyme (type II secretory pathway)